MRTREQLEERIKWYHGVISQMEQEDAKFPEHPIHENDISTFKGAINAIEHLITKLPK